MFGAVNADVSKRRDRESRAKSISHRGSTLVLSLPEVPAHFFDRSRHHELSWKILVDNMIPQWPTRSFSTVTGRRVDE